MVLTIGKGLKNGLTKEMIQSISGTMIRSIKIEKTAKLEENLLSMVIPFWSFHRKLSYPEQLSKDEDHKERILRAYRRHKRPGSVSNRKIHSSPIRCIQRGAWGLRPERKSKAAPTPIVTACILL